MPSPNKDGTLYMGTRKLYNGGHSPFNEYVLLEGMFYPTYWIKQSLGVSLEEFHTLTPIDEIEPFETQKEGA